MELILIAVLVLPISLTIWNIYSFFRQFITKITKPSDKITEIIAIFFGVIFTLAYANARNIVFVNWNEQLYNSEVHSMIEPKSFITFCTIAVLALLGYLTARFIPLRKLPPLVSVICISAMYLGVAECILWSIQTAPDYILMLFPLNCILIFAKTIHALIWQKCQEITNQSESSRFELLSKLLNNAVHWPWIALLLTIPLMGILIAILILFGQKPDSIIKAWTETADWNLSQKIPPQNVLYDEHYLCTVAAGGHHKIVKPLRTGKRHGHQVLVNRQLCIANAFEQILEERIPKIHQLIRGIYDKIGYPIAKHIHSPYAADVIYIVMKPLEWIFLIVLYLFDIKPENRIAVQYPHSEIPKI